MNAFKVSSTDNCVCGTWVVDWLVSCMKDLRESYDEDCWGSHMMNDWGLGYQTVDNLDGIVHEIVENNFP